MRFPRLIGRGGGGEAPAEPPVPPAAAIPDGMRVYAVGDIHGCLVLLDRLLDRIAADDAARGPATTQLVFLGDYVDRGPDSAAVLARLMALASAYADAVFLKGNHEEVLLRVAGGDWRAAALFDRIGGRETLLSYGVAPDAYDAAEVEELPALIQAHVPAAHLAWLEARPDHVLIGDYLFVHAGIRPGVPLEHQAPADLRWIRGEFLDHDGDHGVRVVHGHSITAEVDVRANRIGIDTGAALTGRLTALGVEGRDVWFLATEPAEDAPSVIPLPESRTLG